MTALVYYEPKAGDYLECDAGPSCCWQQWDGYESLEAEPATRGEHARHALTRLSRPPENRVVVTVPPSVEALARVLFETDMAVTTFVGEVADWVGPRIPKTDKEHLFPAEYKRLTDDRRRALTFEKAWNRDEHGWATLARGRAKRMLAMLPGSEAK